MFLNELGKKLGVEEATSSFFCVNYANSGISVQGKIKITQFSSTKIVLNLGKSNLFIYGNNLKLKNFTKTEIGITGTIICTSSVEVSIV